MYNLYLHERINGKDTLILEKQFGDYDRALNLYEDLKRDYEEVVEKERHRIFTLMIGEEDNAYEIELNYDKIESYYDADIDNAGCDGRGRW